MSSGCLRHFFGMTAVPASSSGSAVQENIINWYNQRPVRISCVLEFSFYLLLCMFLFPESEFFIPERSWYRVFLCLRVVGSLWFVMCWKENVIFVCYLYWACIRVSLKRSLKWRGVYRSHVEGSVPHLQFIFFVFKVAEIKEFTPLGSSLHLFSHNQDYLSGSLNDPSGNLKLIEYPKKRRKLQWNQKCRNEKINGKNLWLRYTIKNLNCFKILLLLIQI